MQPVIFLVVHGAQLLKGIAFGDSREIFNIVAVVLTLDCGTELAAGVAYSVEGIGIHITEENYQIVFVFFPVLEQIGSGHIDFVGHRMGKGHGSVQTVETEASVGIIYREGLYPVLIIRNLISVVNVCLDATEFLQYVVQAGLVV